jgi:hypothetical protein
MKKAGATVLLLAVAAFVSGCGGSSSTSTVQAAATQTQSAEAAATTAAPQVTDSEGVTCDSFDSSGWCPGDDPVTCDTTLDPTGWSGGPLTVVRDIGIVAAVSDTDFEGIIEGTLTDTPMHLLNNASAEMKLGGSNTNDQLGNDMTQFENDEDSYADGNGDTGPQDTAYAEQVEKDMLLLVKDCPHAYELGKQMTNGNNS